MKATFSKANNATIFPAIAIAKNGLISEDVDLEDVESEDVDLDDVETQRKIDLVDCYPKEGVG